MDTITALATAPGIGGIAVIRVSGDEAFAIVQSIFSSSKSINDSPSHSILYGKVKDVDPTLSFESRSFNARIVIENPEGKLRPGMFAKLETIVSSRDSAIVISKDIILSKRRGKTVFIVEKNAAQERTIATGLENEQMVEVLSGLKENDRLVIKGFETLRNRSKVKIVR